MDNALKYSPQGVAGGRLVEQDESETRFTVLDLGPGIPEADREKVFIRFYQVGDVDHHSHTGLGLGLTSPGPSWRSTAGGSDGCRAGGGSIFSFGLPRHPAVEAPRPPPEGPSSLSGG